MPVNGKKTRPLAPTVMDARPRRNERMAGASGQVRLQRRDLFDSAQATSPKGQGALLAHYNPDAKRKSPPRFALKSCLAKFQRMCSELISHGTPKENAVAIAAFRQGSDELEAGRPDFAAKRGEDLPGSAGVAPAGSHRHASGAPALSGLPAPLAKNPSAILRSN